MKYVTNVPTHCVRNVFEAVSNRIQRIPVAARSKASVAVALLQGLRVRIRLWA